MMDDKMHDDMQQLVLEIAKALALDARILVLDAGKVSMKKARAVVTELPRSTRLGPGTGLWHRIPAGGENLRVHRRFFKDLETDDAALATA